MLGVEASKRVVCSQEVSAVIKLLAVEGLEGARGDQRESEEQEVQHIRKSSNERGLEAGGLALGNDLGGHAKRQNE